MFPGDVQLGQVSGHRRGGDLLSSREKIVSFVFVFIFAFLVDCARTWETSAVDAINHVLASSGHDLGRDL